MSQVLIITILKLHEWHLPSPHRAPLVGKCDLWKLKNRQKLHIKTHYFTCPNTLSVISTKTDCARTQLVKNTVCTHTVVDIYQHMNIFLNFSPFSLCSIAENIVTLHRQKKKTRQRPSQDNENTTGKLSRQTQGGASRKQEQQVRLVSIDIRLVSNKAILVSKIIVRFWLKVLFFTGKKIVRITFWKEQYT